MSDTGAATGKIQGYVEQLEQLLGQCVVDLQTRPDAFLWNCRRCLECIAYASETRKDDNYQPGTKQGEVANPPRHLPKRLQPEWAFLVGKSNQAVHVQGPDASHSKVDVRACVDLLSKLVRWFFDESGIPVSPAPHGVLRCLNRLEAGGEPPQDFSRLRQEQEARERELLERHQRELLSQSNANRALEARAAALTNEKRQLEDELRMRERELRELRARLAATPEPPRTSTPTPPPVHGLVRESTPPRPRAGSRWLLVGGLLVGSLLLLALQSGRATSRPEAQAATPPTPSAARLDPPEAPSTSAPVVVPAPPPSAPPGPLTCPAGMMKIPGRQFTLRQPVRNAWPPARGVTQTEQVASFCIDQEPVSTTEYRKCVDQHLCDAPRKNEACAWGWDQGLPMACRSQQEAEQFCQKMRQGHLPTVPQLEVAHAIAGKELNFHKRTGEWSLEPFPAPVFQRGPVEEKCKNKPGRCFMIFAPTLSSISEDDPAAKALDLGWNRDHGTIHRADLAFRCVR